jgi:hypothetical protein
LEIERLGVWLLLITITAGHYSLAQRTDMARSQLTSTASRSGPVPIDHVDVYLPPASIPAKRQSCDQKIVGLLCQEQVLAGTALEEADADLQMARPLLRIGEFQSAKQSCVNALNALSKVDSARFLDAKHRFSAESTPNLEASATACLTTVNAAADTLALENLVSLTATMHAYASAGDIEKAKLLHDDLRVRYSQLSSTYPRARGFAETILREKPAFLDWRKSVLGWVRLDLPLIVLKIALMVAGTLILFSLFWPLRWIVNISRKVSVTGQVKWFVQYIKDEENQSAAGAVMDALTVDGNALIRDPFRPPALLLEPPNFGIIEGNGIWWEFFGTVRPLFDIEELPRDDMKKHRFVMDEALDEINIKIAGKEVSGLVALSRNISRWFNKGYPTVIGAILKMTASSSNVSWAVRLTATSRSSWLHRFIVQARRENELKNITISVHSTSQEQEFVDAIGLAAQRSAFKLFYRISRPNTDPDFVTASAAFHQALVLLRRYI